MHLAFKFLILISVLLFLASCNNEREPTEPTSSAVYTEKHRPQFHFSPDSAWMNDPNGMVFFDGEYHLFYQYYPDSTVWGPMHWGHAVSTDLVHWNHLPIALYPDSLGYIFSGSAVLDVENSSGLGSKEKPPLVAIFTHHDPVLEKSGTTDTFQYQSIAYSQDRGRTWLKYKDNPVLRNPGFRDFRDPKVFWHDESQKWIMVLAVKDHVQFYSSTNLTNWTFLSDFGKHVGSHAGVWECPDLIRLQDENGEEYWVLLQNMNPGNPNGGSGLQYFVGQFDGKYFTLDKAFAKLLDDMDSEDASIWLDAGRDNYAGVTWSNVPKDDGRCLFIGWMSNWSYAQIVPTERWRSAMTIVSELKLRKLDGIPRLIMDPVDAMDKLFKGDNISVEANGQYDLNGGLAKLVIQCSINDMSKLGFRFFNDLEQEITFSFDASNNVFVFDRSQSGHVYFNDLFALPANVSRISNDSILNIEVFLDHSSIEIFLDDGLNVFTELFFSDKPFDKLELFADQSNVKWLNGTLTELKGIWQ